MQKNPSNGIGIKSKLKKSLRKILLRDFVNV